jgi:MFS family permease
VPSPGPLGDRVPRSFLAWLVASGVSNVGVSAMYFALGWAATAHGGETAGLVIGTVTLSRTVLLLFGGTIADRVGARRVMLAGDWALLIATTTFALTAWAIGTPTWLLLLAALCEGVVSSFYLPAASSMPRRLVADPLVPRALAMRQSASQLADLVGGPLGGLLVAAAGFAAAAGVDALTYVPILVVMFLLRARPSAPALGRRSMLREASSGLGVALSRPVLRIGLLLTAVTAGIVIPTGAMLVPLLVRSHHWSAATAGFVLGGQSVGGIAVALVVARRNTSSRPGLASLVGLIVMVVGLLTLARASLPVVAAVAGLVIGAGLALFTTHSGPLILLGTPETHISRVQSVHSLVQAATLVVASPLLGLAAERFGPADVVAAAALVLTLGAAIGGGSTAWRTAVVPTPESIPAHLRSGDAP